jgi:hypothetical protein
MTGFQGQLQDFGAFYESTYPVADRVAYGVVGERALAEDATQERLSRATRWRRSTCTSVPTCCRRAEAPLARSWVPTVPICAARGRAISRICPPDG